MVYSVCVRSKELYLRNLTPAQLAELARMLLVNFARRPPVIDVTDMSPERWHAQEHSVEKLTTFFALFGISVRATDGPTGA